MSDLESSGLVVELPTAAAVPAAVVPNQPGLEAEATAHAANFASAAAVPAPAMPMKQAPGDEVNCRTCGAGDTPASAPSYVYAIGRIEPRFPQLSVEKEFTQAMSRVETQGRTDREAMHATVARPENRYLARQICWLMTIGGLETYIIVPRDPGDYDLLIEALRPTPHVTDVDVVVGIKGPIAPPAVCNGLMVPIVAFDQVYSFDVDSLIGSIPRPEKVEATHFNAVAQEVFDRVIQIADNAGATDEHRALNYILMRYPAAYATVAEAHARNASLTAVYVLPSALTGTRRIVDVIFAFTNRNTDVVEKYSVRVDVTEEFPFLLTKISPYFDR